MTLKRSQSHASLALLCDSMLDTTTESRNIVVSAYCMALLVLLILKKINGKNDQILALMVQFLDFLLIKKGTCKRLLHKEFTKVNCKQL